MGFVVGHHDDKVGRRFQKGSSFLGDRVAAGQPFFIGLMVGYAIAVFLSTTLDHFFFWGQGHSVHDF